MPFDDEKNRSGVNPDSPEGLFLAVVAARAEKAEGEERSRLEAAARYGIAALRGEAVAE